MSGHIGKSRFNDKKKQMAVQVFISANNKNAKGLSRLWISIFPKMDFNHYFVSIFTVILCRIILMRRSESIY